MNNSPTHPQSHQVFIHYYKNIILHDKIYNNCQTIVVERNVGQSHNFCTFLKNQLCF